MTFKAVKLALSVHLCETMICLPRPVDPVVEYQRVVDDDMSIGLALNKETKYKRNISHFGPTTLRSTIAYGLLR